MLSLKNIKQVPSLSEETECFSATLYIAGKRAAYVSNRGCGGPHRYDVIPAERAAFNWWVEMLRKKEPKKFEVEDLAVSRLLEMELERRWIRRQVKPGRLLFSLKGDDAGNYRTLTYKNKADARQWLADKYGDKVAAIHS